MKLMKATLPSLWRLTRTTSIVAGLAVMLALVAGVVSLAVAEQTPSGGATASALLKGVQNTANAVTTLINNGTGPALSLQVQPGSAPFTVNSETKVDDLNADKVDGNDSTAFVSATDDGKAPDSELLDGKDSTEFLGAKAKAADSDKLDGQDYTAFASASTGKAYASEGGPTTGKVVTEMSLPEGIYVITGTANARIGPLSGDADIKRPGTLCEIKRDGQRIAHADEEIHPNGAQSLSMTYAFRAEGTVRVTLECTTFPGTEPRHDGKLTAIRVSDINPPQ